MPIRGSHNPSTLPFTLEEIAQKTGARLQALAASPELAGLQAEYEVRSGKPFVELITGARASLDNVDWEKSTGEGRAAVAIIGRAKQIQADMIVIGTLGEEQQGWNAVRMGGMICPDMMHRSR
jgi:nucleotide-binding universal stress UspA family protein